MLSFHYHLERMTTDSARGAFQRESFDLDIRYRGSPEAFNRLMDEFSPEKTADRIVSFIKSGFEKSAFGKSGEPAAKNNFVDYIMPFVRKGVDDALSLFKDFADIVRDPAEKTFDRVKSLLADFAAQETQTDGAAPQKSGSPSQLP